MKITFASHGGWMAGMHSPPQIVDTNNLPKLVAEELSQLVLAAKAEPNVKMDEHARDAMSYTITLDEIDGPTILCQSDTTMSKAFASLLQWLTRHFSDK